MGPVDLILKLGKAHECLNPREGHDLLVWMGLLGLQQGGRVTGGAQWLPGEGDSEATAVFQFPVGGT